MGITNLGQVAALIQGVSVQALAEGATPTVENTGTKANAQFVFGIPVAESRDHNIPRITPKEITSYVTDGTLWKRLNGTNGFSLFEDIYVGDYIKMSRAISAPNQDSQYATTGSQYVTIAGIDTLYYNGDQGSGINYHHLVMVPGKGFSSEKNHFGRKRMNSTNTTEGGYIASEMHTDTIGAVVNEGSTEANATINQQLYAEFGTHLKTIREILTNAISANFYNRFGAPTGAASGWEWASCQAVLMSEVEVYGSVIWSSSGYDIGAGCIQLPLFRDKRALNNRGSYWWLRSIASAAYFCHVRNDGSANYVDAGAANRYVRPRFVLGA
ncbi:MAG: hypothetical protein K6A15_09085 [Treponema sp.]|nr:hypothetical protein [Treponema sp.]